MRRIYLLLMCVALAIPAAADTITPGFVSYSPDFGNNQYTVTVGNLTGTSTGYSLSFFNIFVSIDGGAATNITPAGLLTDSDSVSFTVDSTNTFPVSTILVTGSVCLNSLSTPAASYDDCSIGAGSTIDLGSNGIYNADFSVPVVISEAGSSSDITLTSPRGVPEPASVVLVSVGVAALIRRRKKQ